MQPICDVVIAGGGPAGAAAARLLAAWGFPVTLLTRPPHHPALIESLPPSTTRLLDRLGLLEAVDHAGFLRSTGNTAWWGADGPRREPFGAGLTGYQVPRDRFDALLQEQAAVAGATVHRNTTVRRVSVAGPRGTRTVEYEVDGTTRSLEARWVLDCTGRAGLTARHGGRKSESTLRTTALVATWEQLSWPVEDLTHTLVESSGDGWAWSVPESGTRRQVAVMVDPSFTTLVGGAGLADSYRLELSRTRQLGPMLQSARMIGEPWVRDASPCTHPTPGEAGVLRVGDAASFTDPLSSFGVKKALASAWLAAVVTRTALTDASLEPAALELYNRRERTVAEALGARAAEFAREAAGTHAGEFWARRADRADGAASDELDLAMLRQNPEILAAFAELRSREEVTLRWGVGATRQSRPAIRDDQVAMVEHLVAPSLPSGVRWLRDVDLLRLAEIAVQGGQVPDLFARYHRAVAPVPLPDFLGALAVLVGKGVLDFA